MFKKKKKSFQAASEKIASSASLSLKPKKTVKVAKKTNTTAASVERMSVKKERKEYSPATGGINAFLGKGTEFEGKLIFDGVVRLDGKFKGEIISKDTLVVGESAVIEAEVKVDNIVVSGTIHGNIIAKNRIEVHAPGKIFGNVHAPVFVLEEGVVFEGSCSMGKEKSDSQGDNKPV